jgi:hypothetical protein
MPGNLPRLLMSDVSQSAKGRISIIRAFRKTTGSRSLEHFLLRHFLSDNHKLCYRQSLTNPDREPTMVKRRKKSGRREATAFPMQPAHCFALRRATVDRPLRTLERPTKAPGAARTARVEGPDCNGFGGSSPRCRRGARLTTGRLRPVAPRRFSGRIAARQNLTARRLEMAPQHVEKIESAVGNRMASDASKPQDVVDERAADRALRLTRRWDGSGSYGRAEMAPQRVEKMESACGNGMASDASKPQDVVDGTRGLSCPPADKKMGRLGELQSPGKWRPTC